MILRTPRRHASFRWLAACLLPTIVWSQIAVVNPEELDKKPVTKSSVPPRYPAEEREQGVMGGVLLLWRIDAEGRVERCDVVAQTSESFGRSAWEAGRQWRFAPGEKAGSKVATLIEFPIIFSLSGNEPGDDIFGVMTGFPGSASRDLEPAYRYTEAPKVIFTPAPLIPWRDAEPMKEGIAELAYELDASGRVVGVKVLKASDEAHAGAAMAAVERWRFTPAAAKDGAATAALGRLLFTFDTFVPPDSPDRRVLEELRNGYEFPKLDELDQPLRPISQAAPNYPLSLLAAGGEGSAVIEFFVDHDGWVRLPHVVSATHPAFGYAAAAALAEWRFARPTVKGRAVDVRLRIPVHFPAVRKP